MALKIEPNFVPASSTNTTDGAADDDDRPSAHPGELNRDSFVVECSRVNESDPPGRDILHKHLKDLTVGRVIVGDANRESELVERPTRMLARVLHRRRRDNGLRQLLGKLPFDPHRKWIKLDVVIGTK